MSSAAFAAVDWGTTRMRVWLMDEAGQVLAERRSDEGLLTAREGNRFGAILEAHLAALEAPADLPVFACGMVGARQGWVEAPYVTAPASLDAVLTGAVAVPDGARPVRIVPGMAQATASAPDVMRGEETQLAGIRGMLGQGSHRVCMPGTHSKWVLAEDGRVERFATFLTGEMFSLLAERSILSHSLGSPVPKVEAGGAAFREAVAQAVGDGDCLGRLFSIRAGGLLQGLTPADAAARLSGLLIGGEIAGALKKFGGEGEAAILVASGAMADLYTAALEAAGLAVRPADADEAVRAGLVEAARLNMNASQEAGR